MSGVSRIPRMQGCSSSDLPSTEGSLGLTLTLVLTLRVSQL